MIINSLLDLIGNTPVLRFEGIYVKLESYNLTGSIKDRPAKAMIEGMEADGALRSGDVIVEATSGNTGIALAAIGALKGYKVIIVMPDTMSKERRQAMAAYGADVVLTPGEMGMAGAITEALKLAAAPGYVLVGQFTNKYNARAHEEITAAEIINDFPILHYLVAGIGTGGTISGLAHRLKSHYPDIRVIGIEPAESPVITKSRKGPHGIQGIGAGFIPDILDLKAIDEVRAVETAEAVAEAARLSKNGLFLGISSAAAVKVALELKNAHADKSILAIAPDGGFKYLSMGIYDV